ncbi:variable surface lipoprotein [Mycoplasma struthionis]|uniref:Variable surface lipoprotein n=1 Tax=Mycoplasma struthionis TaxID=538220 RepID=A0A502MI70_9MOLU|nr:variable surface lipoprotein [Mycoplasma struthionis]TPI01177.1 variable surface lipoprotein [Mycoplasma struthionis]
MKLTKKFLLLTLTSATLALPIVAASCETKDVLKTINDLANSSDNSNGDSTSVEKINSGSANSTGNENTSNESAPSTSSNQNSGSTSSSNQANPESNNSSESKAPANEATNKPQANSGSQNSTEHTNATQEHGTATSKPVNRPAEHTNIPSPAPSHSTQSQPQPHLTPAQPQNHPVPTQPQSQPKPFLYDGTSLLLNKIDAGSESENAYQSEVARVRERYAEELKKIKDKYKLTEAELSKVVLARAAAIKANRGAYYYLDPKDDSLKNEVKAPKIETEILDSMMNAYDLVLNKHFFNLTDGEMETNFNTFIGYLKTASPTLKTFLEKQGSNQTLSDLKDKYKKAYKDFLKMILVKSPELKSLHDILNANVTKLAKEVNLDDLFSTSYENKNAYNDAMIALIEKVNIYSKGVKAYVARDSQNLNEFKYFADQSYNLISADLKQKFPNSTSFDQLKNPNLSKETSMLEAIKNKNYLANTNLEAYKPLLDATKGLLSNYEEQIRTHDASKTVKLEPIYTKYITKGLKTNKLNDTEFTAINYYILVKLLDTLLKIN